MDTDRTAEPDSGQVRLEFTAPPEWANPLGNVQGGFLVALLDLAPMNAVATTFEKGELGQTVELKANFISPAPIGKIIGEGRVVHRGKSIAFAEGRLLTPDGTLLAMASATAKFSRPKEWAI